MRIVITGAAGRIGRDITEELSGVHELRLIDKKPVAGRQSMVADLSQRRVRSYRKPWLKARMPRWTRLFEEVDVVVHLAANIRPRANWEGVLPDNIQATWNVIEAAVIHHVPRVVFASSNWAVRALERRMAPDCYLPNGPKIGSDVPPAPVNAYGLSKAFGELAGQMFVEQGKLSSFIAVRIGYYGTDFPGSAEVHTRWIGVQDIRSLFRQCVEVESKGFHVVYGVSAQSASPYDLSDTKQLLGWQPVQQP